VETKKRKILERKIGFYVGISFLDSRISVYQFPYPLCKLEMFKKSMTITAPFKKIILNYKDIDHLECKLFNIPLGSISIKHHNKHLQKFISFYGSFPSFLNFYGFFRNRNFYKEIKKISVKNHLKLRFK
jgi:hypothetical protein